MANNDNFLVLVFRGTEIRRWEDRSDFASIIGDLYAMLALVESEQGGKVHQGFKAALERVWEKEGLLDYLRTKENPSRTLWFTGYSLGRRPGDFGGPTLWPGPRPVHLRVAPAR